MKFSPSAPVAPLSMPSPSQVSAAQRSAPVAAAAPHNASNAPQSKNAPAANKENGKRGGAAPKKRVRLKPETPEQLIERLRNPQLSLHEASILLRVSRATVRRYADSGRLNCQRTPGGQRRFFLRDIENFYRQLKLKR